MGSLECGVWSVECGVWSVECEVLWSVNFGVWGVECCEECQARVSSKSVQQECLARVSSKSVQQECLARVSSKSVQQECLARVSSKECQERVSSKCVQKKACTIYATSFPLHSGSWALSVFFQCTFCLRSSLSAPPVLQTSIFSFFFYGNLFCSLTSGRSFLVSCNVILLHCLDF